MKYTQFLRNFILTISLLLPLSATVMAGKVEQLYHFDNPSVRETAGYQVIELGSTMLSGLSAQPVFPYRQIKLLLPPGESAFDMEINFSDEIVLPGKFTIYPQQDFRPLSEGVSGVFKKDKAVYSSNTFLPADPKGKLITAFLNGRSFALSTFTPVRYNPVTGQLSYYSTARVVVHTAPDPKATEALDNLVPQSDIAQKLADNYSMNKSYASKRMGPTVAYGLLIVCTSEFKDSFKSLQANYLKEGMSSLVATLDSITSIMPGMDVQEKIRNFIIMMYQSHATRYVTLAGDDELIPHRGFYCHVISGSGYTDQNIPSDLYYSALDGNWNTNGDALWGEPGEDDLLPDIAVGRLPFSNATELAHLLNKSYKYQFEPVAGEFRNVLMAGENLYQNPTSLGSDYLNLLKGEHSENGYTTSGIPANYIFDDLYDETATWSKQDLLNHLNQGRPMLNHAGHSNQFYTMKIGNLDITDSNFAGLNGVDHNFTVVYSHGCDCAAFDANDCIAEKMVTINNFAAAFIGNSRYGWFNEGQAEGPSAHLHREFMDALFSDSLNRIGRAHMESKIASAAWVTASGQWEPGALRWCFYDCNLLGDPAMAVFTDNPIAISAVLPASLPVEASAIQANVTSEGLPAKGLKCVAIKDGVLIGEAVTDAAGKSVIVFNANIKSPGTAQLIVSGYNCTPVSYDFALVDYTGNHRLSMEKVKMNISPNPAHDRITVEATMNPDCDFILKVYNNEGKAVIISSINTADSNGRIKKDFDISTLKPGFYLCEIKSDNNSVTRPFIVN